MSDAPKDDLTDQVGQPVGVLLSIQLGGADQPSILLAVLTREAGAS